MKASETKTASQSRQQEQQQGHQPFFQKEGEGGILTEAQPDIQPFFQPAPTATQEGNPFFTPSEKTTPGISPTNNPDNRLPSTVRRLPSTIQPKLKIGRPGDKYEREADSTAERVVRHLAVGNSQPTVENRQPGRPSTVNRQPSTLQPKCAECVAEEKNEKEELSAKEEGIQRQPIFESAGDPPEEGVQRMALNGAPPIQRQEVEEAPEEEVQQAEEGVQMKCADCEGEEKEGKMVQAKEENGEPAAAPSLESRLSSGNGSGSPLPKDTQSSMGSAFGADFSGVRVHTGGDAVQMNQDLGAKAFTHGSDIYFNSGQYDTGSSEGKKLLAHELTHTVQQGGGIIRRKTEEREHQPEDTEANEKEKKDARISPEGKENEEPKKESIENEAQSESQKGEEVVESATPDPKEIKDQKPEDLKEKKEKKKSGGVLNNQEAKGKAKKLGKLLNTIKKKPDSPKTDFDQPRQEFRPLPAINELLKPNGNTEEGNSQGVGLEEEGFIQRVPEDNEVEAPSTFEPQGDIASEYINRINISKETISDRLNERVQSLNSSLEANALSIRENVLGSIQSAINETRNKFLEARSFVQLSVLNTEATLTNKLNVKIEAASADGEATKEEIRSLFGQHNQNIDETVNDKIEASDAMRDHYQDQMDTRVGEQVNDAISRGERKASTYPNTERGRKQRHSVMRVANDTANEMELRKPETIDAIAEIIEPIPDEFREKGQEAKSGVDEHGNNLINDIDQRIQEIITQLREHHQNSLNQLRQLETQLNEQLDQQESLAVNQLDQLIPQVNSQIEDARLISIYGIEESKENTLNQINEKADEATSLLQDGDNANPEAVREFGESILSFMEGASTDASQILSEGSGRMAEESQQIQDNTQESLSKLVGGTDQAISIFKTDTESTLSSFVESFNQGLTAIFESMATAFDDLISQVENQLNSSIQDLSTDMDNTLMEAEGEVVEAMDEGLAQNEEALGELNEKMNEAAEDAAWRHDHPVLAALADIGSFIGGLVLGILAVLLIVVVAIVAFKLIIAGLVALGVSLAVAKLIVLVAGLALLAYGIYRAYQARIERGAEGGWGTFGLSLLDITGITAIYEGATAEGLSTFQRGFLIGNGIATLATFFIGRRLDRAISSRLPRFITNPTRGSIPRYFRTRQSYRVTSEMQARDYSQSIINQGGAYTVNPSRTVLNSSIINSTSGKIRINGQLVNGRIPYVVDEVGNIILNPRQGAVMPHPTAVGGINPRVRAAGIVDIRGGRIFSIDNASGHFQPWPESLINARNAFNGLPSNSFHSNFQGYQTFEGNPFNFQLPTVQNPSSLPYSIPATAGVNEVVREEVRNQ